MIERKVHDFFKRQSKALTFGDVTLKTGYSEVSPKDVKLASRFSRNVPLNIPLVSAAMDTVTESHMAIALAKHGGMGVIHKNMTPAEQANKVARVKFHLSGMVENPITVLETDTIEDIISMKKEKDYSFNSFPVIDSSSKLVGILTSNDFELCDDYSASAKNIMSTSLIMASKNSSLEYVYRMMQESKLKVIPVVDKGKLTGLYTLKDVKRILKGESPIFNIDEKGRLRVAAAIGVMKDSYKRIEMLVDKNVDVLVIDTAHGDSKPVVDMLKWVKKNYSDMDVVVGNISEPHSAERLILAGADGIKVGQGPGSICTTRVVAGIGKPQLSAIYECSVIADKHDVPLIGDGGIENSGDIPKAIGTGADSVMMGSVFSGTDEAPGEIFEIEGRKWKIYRGMGSMDAMIESKSSRERYYQDISGKNMISEGVVSKTPYKGSVSQVIMNMVGGLRNGMGYVGAADIPELKSKADFNLLTVMGKAESHPHNVYIVKDEPNYKEGGK